MSAPVIASLRPTGSSVVVGCPGVPSTVPRIETVVEIRSASGKPFVVRSVSVELNTIQKVTVSSTIGSTDSVRQYQIYNDPFAYRPPVGEFYEKLFALDIPILVPLPKDITSSGYFPRWNSQTTHELYVKVNCGISVESEITYGQAFPVVIKVYDTLPLYRQYNEPVTETRNNSNNQVLIETTIPHSSVGPTDEFTLTAKIMTNHLNNKLRRNIKLNLVTLQIKEIIECHDGGLPPKREYKLFTTTKEFVENNVINTNGISHTFKFKYPGVNDYLCLYGGSKTAIPAGNVDPDEPLTIQSINLARDNYIDKLDDGIPLTHTQGFTSIGSFFTVRYEINLKFKFSHAKDLDFRLPLTVCPYDRRSSQYLLNWIMLQCDDAKSRFGSRFIHHLCGPISYEHTVPLINRFRPPPTIYRYTRADWVRLGYDIDSWGTSGKNLVQYID